MGTKRPAKRPDKKPTKVTRPARVSRQIEIDEAAEMAAQEASSEFEQEIQDPVMPGLFDEVEIPATVDVFTEAFNRAKALNDFPRFYIRKNSQLMGFRDWPYSWEKLMKEFGAGHYHIIAKRISNGAILKQQSDTIGDPSEGRSQDVPMEQESHTDNNLETLAFLQSQAEKAELRAKEASRSSENNLATMMQTIVASQQQSTQTMMTMMMESNKQNMALITSMLARDNRPSGPDPMLTLLTTLLTREPKSDAMKPLELMKLVEDAKKNAREEERRNHEFIEKKSEALAEIKAASMGGDEDESFGKTVMKGFMPVIAQALSQNVQGKPELQLEAHNNPALNQGFVDTGTRPAIPAPPHAPRRPQAQRPPVQQRPVEPRTVPVQAVQTTSPVQNVEQTETVQRPPGSEASEADRLSRPAGGGHRAPQDSVEVVRIKERILDFCAPDIITALQNGLPALKTAQVCLEKLEKEGVPRHTVASTFRLEDFYGYADKYGLPVEVKPWVKEFHESILTLAQLVAAQPANASQTTAVRGPNQPRNASGDPHGAASGSETAGRRPASEGDTRLNGSARVAPTPRQPPTAAKRAVEDGSLGVTGNGDRNIGSRARPGEPAKNI